VLKHLKFAISGVCPHESSLINGSCMKHERGEKIEIKKITQLNEIEVTVLVEVSVKKMSVHFIKGQKYCMFF